MFNQKNLTEMFKGKEFGSKKWLLYLHAEGDFSVEESDCDVQILDGVLEIFTYSVDDETNKRTELEAIDYVPFERIHNISFVKDF